MNSTRPNEVPVASGARGSKVAHVCDRCGESVPADVRVCPECGAPLVPGASSDIPDVIHRDLAKANLLRVRGDYDAAETLCLGVLRRYPNSAPAHTLLGDIADDRGRLEDAERWYELALDLDSQSANDRRKLEDVRARRRDAESQTTVEQIGLPDRQPVPRALMVVAIVVTVALVGLFMLTLRRRDTVSKAPAVVSTPVTATPDAVVAPKKEPEVVSPLASGEPTPTGTPSLVPVVTTEAAVLEDDATLKNLVQKSEFGGMVLMATHEPRTKQLTITYGVKGAEDARRIGAELARVALESEVETLTVVLRAVREGHLAYMADVPRTRYADTLASTWQEENARDPEAFTRYVLSNEWTAPAAPPADSATRP